MSISKEEVIKLTLDFLEDQDKDTIAKLFETVSNDDPYDSLLHSH